MYVFQSLFLDIRVFLITLRKPLFCWNRLRAERFKRKYLQTLCIVLCLQTLCIVLSFKDPGDLEDDSFAS